MSWESSFNNMASSFSGNLAGRSAIGDRDYGDMLETAKRQGFDLNELANRAQKLAQDDMRFTQGVVMENKAFGRGLDADKMRQETYNSMAKNEQQNRFNAAQGLVNAYNDARRTNADLMARTLQF